MMLVSYRYALGHNQGSEPVFRWESSSPDLADRALWNRFHVQGAVAVSLSTRRPPVSLNDLHLPTGAIPIEDVIRFCIVDLGVTPLSDDWDARLRESRRLTRELQSE